MTEAVARPLTPRRERFAQLLASGKLSSADCFRQSFSVERYKPESIHQCASRLAANLNVRSRVQELRARAARAADWSPARVIDELATNATLARSLDTPQLSASNRAYELIGKHVGMWSEAQEPGLHLHLHQHLASQLSEGLSIEELHALRQQIQLTSPEHQPPAETADTVDTGTDA